jgi:hypothetical protein
MNTQRNKLPEIEPYEADYEKTEVVINQFRNSKTAITLFETMDGNFKCLFTDLGEKEFIMLMIVFDKNPQIFAFFKAAIVNTELYRIDEEEAIKYSNTLLENIKMGK